MMEEVKAEDSNGEFEMVGNDSADPKPTPAVTATHSQSSTTDTCTIGDSAAVSAGESHPTSVSSNEPSLTTSRDPSPLPTSNLFPQSDDTTFQVGLGDPGISQITREQESVDSPAEHTHYQPGPAVAPATIAGTHIAKHSLQQPAVQAPYPGYAPQQPAGQLAYPDYAQSTQPQGQYNFEEQQQFYTPSSVAHADVSPYAQTPVVQAPVSYQMVGPSGGYVGEDVSVSNSDDSSMWGWFKGTVTQIAQNNLVHNIVEKTKSSVDSMITALDPQMKEYIRQGGDVDIIVASDKEAKVSPIRQAFQDVFGKADVNGLAADNSIAPQPVGFTAGMKGAEGRIENLRQSRRVHQLQPLLAVEGCLVEIAPDRWYNVDCLLLQDPGHSIELQTYAQAVPVPIEYVMEAQDNTPSDYALGWSGLSITIGQVIQKNIPHVDRADWQLSLTGVSRRDHIYMATKMLAGLYKTKLQALAI
ncbi:PREDICTED: protein PRRC1-like [Priapulus caudatus]|uniref:Protein PRRC1-like n=1 Tax=Priapulus caudatus TaxID=37621 RepID=A0ABM1DQM3_PRICU|nr:PREDICTED: protein PRRC1-like [Priapulus caudatus]XP_014662245.1 PREDICTED: protein PRRC1-like [Priapulus caudatus]